MIRLPKKHLHIIMTTVGDIVGIAATESCSEMTSNMETLEIV